MGGGGGGGGLFKWHFLVRYFVGCCVFVDIHRHFPRVVDKDSLHLVRLAA